MFHKEYIKRTDFKRYMLKSLRFNHFALLCCLITACTKDKCNEPHEDRLEATATVINSGSPALDGCRWLIRIDNKDYSPDNLPENFQFNNIQVKIVYTISYAKFICGYGGSMNYLHLYDIKR